jgi:hypothetical protein
MPDITFHQEPVSSHELGRAIPVCDFEPWVSSLCERYSQDENWLKYFHEKRGISNDIQKELIPLAQFSKQLAKLQPLSKIQYFHGSKQSFDAKILSQNSDIMEVLEITLACNGYQEAIAAESLTEHGYAPLWSNIMQSGKRGKRGIPKPELVSLDTQHIVDECIMQVRNAVTKKSLSNKYENINLIVAFDDFRLLSKDDHSIATKAFREIKSRFSTIYFVGLTGSFFLRCALHT